MVISVICCNLLQSSAKFSISVTIRFMLSSLALIKTRNILRMFARYRITHHLHFTISRQSKEIFVRNLYLLVSKVVATEPGHVELFGFLMVPLRFFILVKTSKSLKRKKPRSLRAPWPDGMDTKSNSKNCRSGAIRSVMPSMTDSSSRKVASRCPFSIISRSLQLICTRMS